MASVTLSPGSANLGSIGTTQDFAAQGVDAYGNATGCASWAWSSSDPGVASVDPDGRVTAVANGTAVVGASGGGLAANATVTVRQVPATVTVSPAGPDTLVAFGATQSYTAQVRDARGVVISDATVSWSSTSGGVASVSGGRATATGNGTTTIQASAGGVSGGATLVVRQAVASVAVSPASFSLALFGTQGLAASATDPNGNTVTRSLSWSWQSDNTVAVTVTQDPGDGSRATATRSAPGTATITATTGGRSGTATVN